MRNILVLRFSALGDVALTLPVLQSVLLNNKDLTLTIATRAPYAFLFEGIDRLQVLPIDLQNSYKGIFGMYKLYKHLSFKKFDAVVDLHDVTRTQVLRTLFSFNTKVVFYKKGRREKLAIIKTKKIVQLKHTIDRYTYAFEQLQLEVNLKFLYPIIKLPKQALQDAQIFTAPFKQTIIGFAPFAAHVTKSLSIEKAKEILQYLLAKNVVVFLYAGSVEQPLVKELIALSNNIINTHSLNFEAQIATMSYLKTMIAVDSGNMHLAALQGVHTTSLWGSTLPQLGFAPVNQQLHKLILLPANSLSCQPCSVYGKKPCTNKNKYACLNLLALETIFS